MDARGAAWSTATSRFVLSAGRLMGFYSWKATISPPSGTTGTDDELSGTQVNLLYGNSTAGDGDDTINPPAMPRVAFDFVVASGLTLGGSIGYATTSGEYKTDTGDGTSTTFDFSDNSAFFFTPRIGYLIPTSAVLTIWLRGGLAIYSVTSEEPSPSTYKVTYSGTQLALDPMLVFTPVDHVGILLGPALDIAMSGNWEASDSGTSVEGDFRLSSFGVAAGLAAFF
jgi:hypothetical protein